MCGISGIINRKQLSADELVKCTHMVAHRGPDDEGYLLWSPDNVPSVFVGRDSAEETQRHFGYQHVSGESRNWRVGLGHRRLSILDLSPGGHQPMVYPEAGLAISFNGEIYNYIEIRQELQRLGHVFKSNSDTEVILHAWAQWGRECMHHFNGMFAFLLLDYRNQQLYAVRDRFGVKPLYYTEKDGYFAFSSEVKQLRSLPEYKFEINPQIAYDYLRFGLVDHEEETFEQGIHQVMPGHFLSYDLKRDSFEKVQWYVLQPKTWRGDAVAAEEEFRRLLKDSVRLRMRADVPVGSALSGGLDSSTVVCLMREVLNDAGHQKNVIQTITSCNEDKRFDEWSFAEAVINRVRAASHKVFPSFEKLQEDLAKMIWHLDYPFGSTSQFSQWCVFEEAHKQGLTVMIDGQGADEQLAGYGGNDVSLYAGLLGAFKFGVLYREVTAYNQAHHQWPKGFLLNGLKTSVPFIKGLFGSGGGEPPVPWLRHDGFLVRQYPAKSLRQNLMNQVQKLPLPSLLRYEDRNSMAFSVESRVPFMDYRLMEFTLGLPESLVYRNGERKHILRKSFRGIVPDVVLDRKDKMGFVSAEEKWMIEDRPEWFRNQLRDFSPELNKLLDGPKAEVMFGEVQSRRLAFSFEPWRIMCLKSWFTQIQKPSN